MLLPQSPPVDRCYRAKAIDHPLWQHQILRVHRMPIVSTGETTCLLQSTIVRYPAPRLQIRHGLPVFRLHAIPSCTGHHRLCDTIVLLRIIEPQYPHQELEYSQASALGSRTSYASFRQSVPHPHECGQSEFRRLPAAGSINTPLLLRAFASRRASNEAGPRTQTVLPPAAGAIATD